MSEETTTQTQTTADDPIKAAMYQRDTALAEAVKLKQQIKDLQGKVLSDDDKQLFESLRERETKAEEERKRKSGEFDTWRKEIADKHTREIQEREGKYSSLSDRFKNTVVAAEFGRASDYFGGGEASKTILDVDLGMAALGKYVAVEDVENDPLGYRVVVRYPSGDRILGEDGNPAPFTEAIGELIAKLPNKDRILRGSGKTGSGSSGGSTHAAKSADVSELTKRAQAGDKEALAALRARRANSNALQMGSAFTR